MALMREIHGESLSKSEPVKVVAKEDGDTLWDLEGIPNYIVNYVEKIENFSGDFIDVFL